MNFYVHHHTITIYIQYHFHEITSICYLFMAEDGNIDRQMEKEMNGQHQTFKIVCILCNIVVFYIFEFDILMKLYLRNPR